MRAQRLLYPVIIAAIVFIISQSIIYADDVWADYFGTSSTSGTWDTGTRYNPNSTMKPPLLLLWKKTS